MSRRVGIGSALAFLGAVAGCATTGDNDSRVLLQASPAVGAKLAAKGGSAVAGLILFRRRDGGLTMVVQLHDVMPGPYRVAIHTTGNCSSSNAFSAGPPWTPQGGVPQIYGGGAGNAGLLMMTASLDGVSIDGPDGILGKSIVIHQGLAGPVDAQPGVPNNRVACGVIQNIASHEF
jgi:Cu-Zn family superoxide dismutase